MTFVVATVAFPVGAGAWLLGQSRMARAAGVVGFVGWVLTAVVFQLLLSGSLHVDPMHVTAAEVLAWTFVAGMAAFGMRQPRPRVAAPALAATIVLALLFTDTGAQPVGESSGYLILQASPAWMPRWLYQGVDTLLTSALVAWALLAVAGLALWRLDPRPAFAALWLLPFFGLSQLQVTTITFVAVAGLVVAAALALGMRQQRIATA